MIHTAFYFLNSQNPDFLAAKNGTEKEKEHYQDNNGTFENNPGTMIDCASKGFVKETDEEYGGWIIDVRNLPPGTTHIKVERG